MLMEPRQTAVVYSTTQNIPWVNDRHWTRSLIQWFGLWLRTECALFEGNEKLNLWPRRGKSVRHRGFETHTCSTQLHCKIGDIDYSACNSYSLWWLYFLATAVWKSLLFRFPGGHVYFKEPSSACSQPGVSTFYKPCPSFLDMKSGRMRTKDGPWSS